MEFLKSDQSYFVSKGIYFDFSLIKYDFKYESR